MGEAQHAAILRWLAVAELDAVTLTCAEAPLDGALVLDGCLAETPLAWVAELAVHSRVRIAADHCARRAEARAGLADLARLTPRVTLNGGPTPGAQVRYSAPPARRRGLLGLGGTIPPPTGTLAERLSAALSHLPRAENLPSPAAQLVVNDNCTACGVCVRSCPHDALTLSIDDGVAALTQRLPSCEGDGACVAWCPEDALRRDGQHPWEDVLTAGVAQLMLVPVRRCPRCQTTFAKPDAEPLCPVCRVQEADEFAVHLPPAAQALLERRRRNR